MVAPQRTSRLILPRGRPMVVAHRGASHRIAEHTLSAYVSAIETGADAVECDVRLTADGVLVCVHDRLIDRVSNGQGAVSELELARLREMDFSSWHDALLDGGDALHGRGRQAPSQGILTLEELLSLGDQAGRPITTLIETRHPTRYSGEVEKILIRTLREHGLADGGRGAHRVAVMSFSRMALRRIRLLAPDIPLVLLQRLGRVPRPVDGRIPPYVDAAGPGWGVLRRDPDYVDRVHALGGKVFVWTVDEHAQIDAALDLGVDAVITNQPAEVLAHITARAGR